MEVPTAYFIRDYKMEQKSVTIEFHEAEFK
jgi:hypothetical protein